MKTGAKKSTSTVNTHKNKENVKRQPLSDKTNDANTSNNMKRKKNEKQSTRVTSKVQLKQTRKTCVGSRQNRTKNEVGLNLDTNNTININLESKNVLNLKNKTVLSKAKTTLETDTINKSSKLNDSLKKTLEKQKNTKNIEISINEQNRLTVRRRSSRFSNETKITASKSGKGVLKSNKDVTRSNKVASKSKKEALKSTKDASKLDTNLKDNPQQTDEINNSINKLNKKSETDKIINTDKQIKDNKENSVNALKTNVRRRSSRFSSETEFKTTKSNKGSTKCIKDSTIINKDTSKSNKNASKSNKDASKLGTTLQVNPPQTDEINNSSNEHSKKIDTAKQNKENTKNVQNKSILKHRSSRFSNEVKIKTTSKSNKNASNSYKDASISKKDTSKSNKDVSSSSKDGSKSIKDAPKLDTILQETDKQTEEKPPIKTTRRLLDCLKSPSPENSDPYEFKFDPKKEPKRIPKKRGRPKKCKIPSDTSEEEDNSMKPIIKNIRKKIEVKQKIRVKPVERNLRNNVVKVKHQAALALEINNENNVKNSEKIAENTDVIKINTAPEINNENNVKNSEKIAENTDVIKNTIAKNTPGIKINTAAKNTSVNKINTAAKNTSVVDEINEIANTFLEDDDLFNDSNISISTPSRIDIISNLIARKSIRNPPVNVFNSTMIHETPQQQQHLSYLQSPWRVEVSAIPRKSLNFSVKNKSFTPSYTPEIITDNKKQSTLLGFVNRTPKTDLQVTLFQNSPPRKPFQNLSNSMSPIRPNRSNNSTAKRSDDSLFGFTVLSDSEDKENSPIVARKVKSPRNINILNLKQLEVKKQTSENDKINEPVKNYEPVIDIPISLFEDLDEKQNKKRYSRQYTRPQTKRKRNISYKIDSGDDSESETEIYPIKKKQKDVLSKEEAEEVERLASHYNSYFEEIENYPLCIE